MRVRILKGRSSACSCWKRVMSLGLNWKLFVSIGGLTMLEGTELGYDIVKSYKVVVVGSMMAYWSWIASLLRLRAWRRCAQKVASISESNGCKSLGLQLGVFNGPRPDQTGLDRPAPKTSFKVGAGAKIGPVQDWAGPRPVLYLCSYVCYYANWQLPIINLQLQNKMTKA